MDVISATLYNHWFLLVYSHEVYSSVSQFTSLDLTRHKNIHRARSTVETRVSTPVTSEMVIPQRNWQPSVYFDFQQFLNDILSIDVQPLTISDLGNTLSRLTMELISNGHSGAFTV
jgi:hypothetical protein